jgi:hypothetical protein
VMEGACCIETGLAGHGVMIPPVSQSVN